MAFSEAKLKSSGDRAYPCFRPFWIRKLSDNFNYRGLHPVARNIQKLLNKILYQLLRNRRYYNLQLISDNYLPTC
jgi:hypothetical protein